MRFKFPSQSTLHSRKSFHMCQRKQTENVESWLLKVKQAIASCEYETLTNFILIDKFLSGLSNDDLEKFSQHASYTDEHILRLATGFGLEIPISDGGEDVNVTNDSVSLKNETNHDECQYEIKHYYDNSCITKDETAKIGEQCEFQVKNIPIQIISKSLSVESQKNHCNNDTKPILKRRRANKNEHPSSYVCQLCGVDYSCRSKFEVHLRSHQHVEKDFECHLCGMQCHSLLALKVHFSRMHTGIKRQRLPCSECEKSFLERVALERHIRIHKGLAEVYKCPHCDKEFDLHCRMKAHSTIHSVTREEHICETCGQIYRSRKLLNMHRSTHSDMRYKCQTCGLLLKNSNTYRIHQRQHTGERPHQCNLCPKTFVTAPSYKKHLMVHNNIKPHACKICSGRFATPYHLKIHLYRHTGEKPYQCDQCATRFSQPQSLKSHVKRFHQQMNSTQ